MIKRNYIANVEAVRSGKTFKWGTHSFHTKSLFAPSAGEVAEEIRQEMAKFLDCSNDEVRIVGVFKL